MKKSKVRKVDRAFLPESVMSPAMPSGVRSICSLNYLGDFVHHAYLLTFFTGQNPRIFLVLAGHPSPPPPPPPQYFQNTSKIICNSDETMDHIHNYFRRHKICNFMPVHGGLELSALISSSHGSNNSTKHWTPQLLFLGSCVCSKIGFLHRLCISNFS